MYYIHQGRSKTLDIRRHTTRSRAKIQVTRVIQKCSKLLEKRCDPLTEQMYIPTVFIRETAEIPKQPGVSRWRWRRMKHDKGERDRMVIRTQRVVCPNINARADQVLGGDNQINDAGVSQTLTGKAARVIVGGLTLGQCSIPTLKTILAEPRNQKATSSVTLAITKKRDMPSVEVPTEHSIQLRWVFTDRQRAQDLKHLTIIQGGWKVATVDKQGRYLNRKNIG
jgi:NADPH-dependent ferric siderophore reductase